MMCNSSLRRKALALASAFTFLCAATACGGDSSSAPSTLTVATYPILASLPLEVAKGEGYFDDAGIDVDSVNVASGPAATQALASGEADLMPNSLDNALVARGQGIDLVSITGILQDSYLTLVLSSKLDLPDPLPDYPEVMTLFKGLDIGVVARGTSPELAMTELLKGAGMTASDVNYIPVGLPAAAIDAFRQGTVDGGVWFEPFTSLAQSEGLIKIAVDLREGEIEYFDWQYSGWIAPREAAEEKSDAMVKFHEAMDATYAFMQDEENLDAVVEYASTYLTGGNKELATTLMKSNMKYFGSDVSEQSVERASKFLMDAGLLDEPVDPSEYLIDLP